MTWRMKWMAMGFTEVALGILFFAVAVARGWVALGWFVLLVSNLMAADAFNQARRS